MSKPPNRPQLPPQVELRIEPLGAIGGVTGSRTLITTAKSRVLVDCGMFQGSRSADRLNKESLGVRPSELDGVLLTHAHIDHSGRLPLLVKPKRKADRLSAPIHATSGTAELLPILLRDSAHIQVSDAQLRTRRARRRGGRETEPLYTGEDVEWLLNHVEGHEPGTTIQVTPDIRARFRDAGHILGAASIELEIQTPSGVRRVVFSGDIGRKDTPLLCDPEVPHFEGYAPDLVICESTYGDREHRSDTDTAAELIEILERSKKTGGTVVIPVFAVGRAQELLYSLRQAFDARPELSRQVVLDSPMAISVTRLYEKNATCFLERCHQNDPCTFEPQDLLFTRSTEQSMALNNRSGMVILSASGMCNAGRILHHLKHRLWVPQNEVVIVGYQARGTLGRQLVDGRRRVRIMGEDIAVRATVSTLGGYSAHAGQSELLEWIQAVTGEDTTLALNHGEDEARLALAELAREAGIKPALMPAHGQRFEWQAESTPQLLPSAPSRPQ